MRGARNAELGDLYMTTNKFIESLRATTKEAKNVALETESDLADLMTDPDYLRQSSSLINEALQKGFDVLQLANGDIVTTGTKTIVHQYTWDTGKGKLTKMKQQEKRTRRSRDEKIEETLDEDM